MKHLKKYHLFESETQQRDLFDACEQFLSGFPLWETAKQKMRDENPDLQIIEEPHLSVDAQFDAGSSDETKIVILVNPGQREDSKYKATMAHELVHVLQFIRDGELDLFINDVTREFEGFSDNEEWLRLLMAIYLTDPIEIEAKKAEMRWNRDPLTMEMISWMDAFDPISFEKFLSGLVPLPNEFDLESFDELPELWFSVYVNYMNQEESGQPISSEMRELEGASLLEFLQFYDRKFKKYRKELGF
jgi:hypothetical protein